MDDAPKYNGETEEAKRTQRTFSSHSFYKPEVVQSLSASDLRRAEEEKISTSPVENTSATCQAADIDHDIAKTEHRTGQDSVALVPSPAGERRVPALEISRGQVSMERMYEAVC